MSVKTTKVENYSITQIAAIVALAASNDNTLNSASVDTLLENPIFKSKERRSLIAKVSQMARTTHQGVFTYETKKRQSVNGGAIVRKNELVTQLEAVLGFSVDTFEQGSKVQLEKVLAWATAKAA